MVPAQARAVPLAPAAAAQSGQAWEGPSQPRGLLPRRSWAVDGVQPSATIVSDRSIGFGDFECFFQFGYLPQACPNSILDDVPGSGLVSDQNYTYCHQKLIGFQFRLTSSLAPS